QEPRQDVELLRKDFSADVFIAAPGPLSEPKLPAIGGIESFAGELFHSAQWNHGHDLTDRRVGVIGTGASAIQFVPKIQPRVRELVIFQRTAPWIIPHHNRPVAGWEQRLYHALPVAQRLVRGWSYASREVLVSALMNSTIRMLPEMVARSHMRRQVPDPELRRKLTPNYGLGCKRILLSNDYFPALCQSNVSLVCDPIESITAAGVRTASAGQDAPVQEHAFDTIILGTGFHVTDIPMAQWVTGAGGRTLAEVWQGSPQAHLGTLVAGFPNLFMLYGPNTNLGHNSVIFMIESQLNLVLDCLREMERRRALTIEVSRAAQTRFNDRVQDSLAGSVWNSGGCRSWYLDQNGRNSSIWPGSTWTFHRRTLRLDPHEYLIGGAHDERQRGLQDGVHPLDRLAQSGRLF
ncbi:MAG: flavin-containing monooxygenase, partial [Solirubrobacteraceae bacterium]